MSRKIPYVCPAYVSIDGLILPTHPLGIPEQFGTQNRKYFCVIGRVSTVYLRHQKFCQQAADKIWKSGEAWNIVVFEQIKFALFSL